MQSCRAYNATPVVRVLSRRAPASTANTATRNMAYCTPFGYRVARRSAASPAAHFFPAALQADLSPFMRAFDELENLHAAATSGRHAIRSFQPRFDVREEKDAYHLQGELPGVSQDNISIEFTDRSTLVVRGQTVRERQAGTPPKAVQASAEEHEAVEDSPAATEPAAEVERAATPASDDGSNYHQPTVEEDREEGWTEAVPTPATTATEVAKSAEQQVEKTSEQKPAKEQAHYWVSERSVGSFQRVFNFSNPVDQEAVTANLKDGILSVVVPKEQPKQPRKITIQ